MAGVNKLKSREMKQKYRRYFNWLDLRHKLFKMAKSQGSWNALPSSNNTQARAHSEVEKSWMITKSRYCRPYKLSHSKCRSIAAVQSVLRKCRSIKKNLRCCLSVSRRRWLPVKPRLKWVLKKCRLWSMPYRNHRKPKPGIYSQSALKYLVIYLYLAPISSRRSPAVQCRRLPTRIFSLPATNNWSRYLPSTNTAARRGRSESANLQCRLIRLLSMQWPLFTNQRLACRRDGPQRCICLQKIATGPASRIGWPWGVDVFTSHTVHWYTSNRRHFWKRNHPIHPRNCKRRWLFLCSRRFKTLESGRGTHTLPFLVRL